MAWRSCNASLALIAEINERWPNRDKASDGTIGDTAHSARWTASDHNPFVVVDGVGVVRARDIDKDGIDAARLAEYLRRRGEVGDPRLIGGGYVIFNRRITRPDFTGWRVYNGVNPHTHHVHVSFSRDRVGFDSTAGWGITVPAVDPSDSAPVVLQPGESGDVVRRLQTVLRAWYPTTEPFASLAVDGDYGPATEAAVRDFQTRAGLTPDGIAGPQTLAALRII